MSEPEPPPTTSTSKDAPPVAPEHTRREGIVAVTFWLVAGAIYVVLGLLVPWAFLLGFWQALIFVAVATAVQPVIVRRFG